METAVCSPASLAPRFDAMLHPVDADADADAERDADVSVLNFPTNTSSHGDDDMKGSDGWRLASDASTTSSRVTTPEPQPPPPLPPMVIERPFPRQIFGHPPPPALPPPKYRTSSLEHDPSSTKQPNGAAIQPPPPLVDVPDCDAFQRSQTSGLNRLPSHPPPPPRPLQYNDRNPGRHGPIILPPPPATDNSNIMRRGHLSQTPQHLVGHAVSAAGDEPSRSNGQRKKKNRCTRRTHHTHGHSNSSESGSSTFSLTRPSRAMSWSSASSSEEDPIAYRNSRQFPPEFPAPPTSRDSAPRSRSLATNRITSWVSQYEKSQSPRRMRLGGIAPTKLSEEVGSRDEGSVLSDASSYAEVELLWQQLKEKRAKLNDIKVQMAKRRQELRHLRRRKEDADNAFMSIIRPMLVSQRGILQTSFHLLDSRAADMQDLRNDYHSRESDYEALELMVDDEEKQLNGLETRFFSLLAAGQTKVERASPSDEGSSETESSSPSDLPFELRGISADKPSEDLHPLYVELTEAVGDLENAREEYDDLLYVKDQYEYEAQLKKTIGKKTTADMEEFFVEFPAEEDRMKAEVSQLEGRVDRLKKLCEDKKVMRKHMSVRMAYTLDPHTKFEDMELEDRASILARHKTLAHPIFPELLSQPDYVLAEPEPRTSLQALRAATRLPNDDAQKRDKQRLAAKEYSIDSLMRGEGTGGRGDFVNRWLLHQLRISHLNVQILHSTFVSNRSLKIRDLWRWQCDVMYYWSRDNTVALTEGVVNRITSAGSDYSSRLGTPQMSRAASDGQARRLRHRTSGRLDSDDAVTVGG
ncbi:hypothetical protein TOPH_03428 [Tolypocladium ophioglossoides CBS 100239]|uniref:Uncharacterized protein n=1 Tax=Tolypocladium ophioglossoides (strain CBS 100239) TaxID=1163406 RepID=A0A0L0NDE8_TOLOC|nr:hypothetical protein TOPH_03428 [Tolypocladium ophioglossoides CBS 100239]